MQERHYFSTMSNNEKIKIPLISKPNSLTSSKSTAVTALQAASYSGDLGRVSEIINRSPDLIHECDDDGRTALHVAAYQSAINVCTKLLCTVLETDVVVPFKRTLRDLRQRTTDLEKSLVSEEDHRLCEQWLSEEKERQCLDFQLQCSTVAAQILSRSDINGCTPLHYAATTRDDTLIDLLNYSEEFSKEKLLSGTLRALIGKQGSGPGHGVKEDSLLREERERREDRMKKRTTRLTKQIWKNIVNNVDERKNTILHFAACSGSTSAVRELVRWGANHAFVNDNGQTPLDVAEEKTCRNALLRLPQAVDEACDRRERNGSDNNSENTDTNTNTVLDGAIKSLLDHGEHVNATTSIQGETALHRACSRGATKVVIELLDSNGADPHATDANGWTGLHWCGYYASPEHGKIARELLDRDVDVDARTLRNRTPLMLATLQNHVCEPNEAKKYIKGNQGNRGSRGSRGSHGGAMDENTRTHKRMPEYKRIRTKNASMGVVDVIELLARRGADLEAVDVNGKTALHFAAKKGDPRIVYSLLLLGCNVYSTTQHRTNALHIAVESARRSVVRLLVRYDAEKRMLKQGRDASNKIPADAAPDQKTRNSLISLWEACEDGKLELTRRLLLDNPSTSPTNPMEPWAPVGISDTTISRKLSCLHLVARGAGKCCKNNKLMFEKLKKKDRGASSFKLQQKLDLKMNAYRQITALLLRRGCTSEARDVNDMTPLMVCAMEGASSLIAVLVTGSATGKGKGTGRRSDEEEERVERLLGAEDKSGNTAMHYAMAFRQIACANALEALGADILQENKREETATAVAGIGIQLASHLRRKKKNESSKLNNNSSSNWRSSVTDDPPEGKRDEEETTRETARRPAPPPSSNTSSTRNVKEDSYEDDDYNEEDRDEASEILRASARDVSGSGTSSSTGGVTAARPPPRRTTVKTADRERATNMLKASASSLNDTDGSSGQSSSSSNRPIAKPPSRSATMTSGSRSARPPSRPTGRSRTATSSLKAAAASLD